MEELNEEFSEIAKKLVQSNMSLECQVPSAITGPVAWTIPEYDENPVYVMTPLKESKPFKFWLGVNANIGYGLFETGWYYGGYNYEGMIVGLGADLAFPVTERLSVGVSVGGVYDFYGDDAGGYGGALAKYCIGKSSALLLGAGVVFLDDLSLYAKLGWKYKPWYFSITAFPSGIISDMGGVMLGIGYSIFDDKANK